MNASRGQRPPDARGDDRAAGASVPPCPRRLLLGAVCGLGVSAVVTQLVLLRELLCVLAGNELVFGVILGNWFLLTGAGASLGRLADRLRRPVGVLVVAQLLIAVLPVATVVALRGLRHAVVLRGSAIGPGGAVAATFLLLMPYCLLTGFLLALAARLLTARRDAAGIGKVYVLDVLGDVAGGLLFTFLLVHLGGHFFCLLVPAALNLALAAAVTFAAGRRGAAGVIVVLGAAGVAGLGGGGLARWAVEVEHPGRRVLYAGTSPYGRLVVTGRAGQVDFLANGLPVATSRDVRRVEETVHYAMAQRPDAGRVLLLGGGYTGTAREVVQYPRARVDYVELDPQIIAAARRFLPGRLDHPRIAVHAADGRQFVRAARGAYDVAVVDVPDPATGQLNRLYTVEFFGELHRALSAGGVAAVSIGSYHNVVSDELAGMVATLRRSLATAFGNVLVLPGARVVVLASDGELTADIAARVAGAGVEAEYATDALLRGTLTPDRLAELDRATAAGGDLNRDFSPVLYYQHLRYWLSRFRPRMGALVLVAGAALAVWMLSLRPVTLAVFGTGFAASAGHLVILLGFQIVHGTVYHQVGLLVTVFMAGLALGGHLAGRRLVRGRPRRQLAWLALAAAAVTACLPVVLASLASLAAGGWAWLSGAVGFPAVTLILATLVGMAFPVAARADFRGPAATAGRLYAADYIGACVGALLVGTVLVPLAGLTGVCLLAAGLPAAGAAVVAISSLTEGSAG